MDDLAEFFPDLEDSEEGTSMAPSQSQLEELNSTLRFHAVDFLLIGDSWNILRPGKHFVINSQRMALLNIFWLPYIADKQI